MHRLKILDLLKQYGDSHPLEKENRLRMINFIESNPHCFESVHPPVQGAEAVSSVGHITGSAWILNSNYTEVLLTHHRKLNMWIQLGGHSDGHFDVLETALREAKEESGINSIRPLSTSIFDIDIHEIPGKNDRPVHLHYDIRFIFESPETSDFSVSEESHDLKWVKLSEISNYTSEESMLRMCKKTEVYL